MSGQTSNQDIPTQNRPATIIGTTVTFLTIAWIAALLRFTTRWMQRPKILWWDDLFLFIACLSTTAGSVIVCLLPGAGMGRRTASLTGEELTNYFKFVYASNVTYAVSATVIKISILIQYLRLFDVHVRLARRLTYAMMALVFVWGLCFLCIIVFGCTPISLNWNLSLKGRCFMFGSKDENMIFKAFASHIGSNVCLDALVFTLPLPFLRDLRLTGRRRLGLIGLFTMGSSVVIIALARLIAFCVSYGTVHFDLTYYAAQIFILTVLEINIAILCASVPIFWPVVSALALGKSILVVNEITIHTSKRDSHPTAPLARKSGDSEEVGMELGRRVSQESGKRLARSSSKGSAEDGDGRDHYQDRYVQEWVVPDFDKGVQTTTVVERAHGIVPEDFVSRALK